MTFFQFLKKNLLIIFLLFFIFILFLNIFPNNIKKYNTWDADDGGAHLTYLQSITSQHRLPTKSETYLAWHEPLYYLILGQWMKLNTFFNFQRLNWGESLNSIFYFLFLILIFVFNYYYTKKNKYLALLNVFLFSTLFVGIKLSAYINNELLVQILIVFLAFLFIHWKLLEQKKLKYVLFWAFILALTSLVKLSAFILLISVLIVWITKTLATKKLYPLIYILLTLVLVGLINVPWFKYKQKNFISATTINIFEYGHQQNILKSDAWNYLFAINTKTFTTYPYWFSKPHSFISIFIADSFGDYYNLFNNPQKINKLPKSEKILIKNGRYASKKSFQTMLKINKIAILISLIWIIGLLGSIKKLFQKFDWDKFFLIILLFGGYSALIYNNLRFPYLERGVLKASFIFFTFPILTILSYQWWWQKIKNKIIWIIISFFPIMIYLIIAWPIIKI